MTMKQALLTRRATFAAGHRYHVEAWSAEKNQATFGKCNLPYGHGHNYVVEVTVEGTIDEETGMVINLVDLDRIIHEVIEPLDHRFLNHEIPYFAKRVPTTENLALYLAALIVPKLTGCKLAKLRLYEDPTLWAEVVA
jgi:6-pyruvoyltetrahydropterin/6-carboxytetrahydropterin synthase